MRKRKCISCLGSTREAKPGGERKTVRRESERRGPGGHHDGTFKGWRLGQGRLPEGGGSKGLRNNGRRSDAEKWRPLQDRADAWETAAGMECDVLERGKRCRCLVMGS